MKIKIRNQTQHGLAVYGKGDTLTFRLSPAPADLQSVSWTLCDGYRATTAGSESPGHIMTAPGTAHAGEGFAWAKAKVRHADGRTEKLRKRFFVSPQMVARYSDVIVPAVQRDDVSVTVPVNIQFVGGLELGYPLSGGRPGYACGGACQDSCPLADPVFEPPSVEGLESESGQIVFTQYGRYQVRSRGSFRVHAEDCIRLYRDSIISQKARYRPLVMTLALQPAASDLSLSPLSVVAGQLTTFVIEGLATAMLPIGCQFEWSVDGSPQTVTSVPEHQLALVTAATVTVSILIPQCAPLSVEALINVSE